jgi:hypothetical protein
VGWLIKTKWNQKYNMVLRRNQKRYQTVMRMENFTGRARKRRYRVARFRVVSHNEFGLTFLLGTYYFRRGQNTAIRDVKVALRTRLTA